MTVFVGEFSGLALFSDDAGKSGVVVDIDTRSVVNTDRLSRLENATSWTSHGTDSVPPVIHEIAHAALTTLDIDVVTSSAQRRTYSVPAAAASEATRGLRRWTDTHDGGSPVAVNIALSLTNAQHVSYDTVKTIADYFASRGLIKTVRATGDMSPAQVTQALYGGMHAARWAASIVRRERSMTADGLYSETHPVDDWAEPDLSAFDVDDSDDEPSFVGLCVPGTFHVVLLLVVDPGGDARVWDSGRWHEYPNALDQVDTGSFDLVDIDPETALEVSARLQERPWEPVDVFSINDHEATLALDAMPELDNELLDAVMAAAGADDEYTPDERSENARRQVRDKNGRFAKTGTRVQSDAGEVGVVKKLYPESQEVDIVLDNGQTVRVPASQISAIGAGTPTPPLPRLNLEGIIAQPRAASQDAVRARLPGLLPMLDAEALKRIVDDYQSFIEDERRKNASRFAEASSETSLTPDTTDVKPVYLAIVAPDDPQAVLELVALVPASKTSSTPTTFKREAGKWVADPKIVNQLRSSNPPPVVTLDDETFKSVLEQVDATLTASLMRVFESKLTPVWGPNGEILSLVSAGGLDRNRGGAERLRRYWTVGPGGLKIRWNTPGDWKRCVRHLAKYLGPRAKGYCALRHHEMTGMWTGDRLHRQMYGRKGFSIDEDLVNSTFAWKATADIARARVAGAGIESVVPALAEQIDDSRSGSKFVIPVLIPENVESGDGRLFAPGSLRLRDLPIPLLWQIESDEGHTGSVLVGRIDSAERTARGIGNAFGVFDTGPYGREAERLVRGGFLRGVSADLDQFEASEDIAENSDDNDDDDSKIGGDKLRITRGRVMAATLVPKPAFQECVIELVVDEPQQEEQPVIPDGTYIDEVEPLEAAALTAAALVAGAIPVNPPRSWFSNPKLAHATPLTVDDDGRVYGHIAAWHVDHIGMPFGTRPPRSRSGYSYFHTGVVRTADGDDIPVGQLTLSGGHAPLEATAAKAIEHYDDTGSAFADVHAGEDAHGIWVAGALRPGTTPEQIRQIRASAPSGDWRPIKGSLELVAVCQVNVPGFPIARARVASGRVLALVAAGASTLVKLRETAPAVDELTQRVAQLEQLLLAPKIEDARSRFASVRAERREKASELSARVDVALDVDGYVTEFKSFSPEKREKLAREKKAMPDGSYPIENVADLRRAVRAYGRASDADKPKVKRHIIRRARGLHRPDLIPESWGANSSEELAAEADTQRERFLSTAGEQFSWVKSDSYQPKFTPDTQPRDAHGRFREVLARLKLDLGDVELDEAVRKVEEAENLDDAGNYAEAARAAHDVIDIVDRIDAGAINPEAVIGIREGARALGEVIANLPLPTGYDAEKVKYSDLPPALRTLVDDMIARVVEKIGEDDAREATIKLEQYRSGSDVLSQSEISSELSKLLRLLT